MNILFVSLASHFTDGMTYQDNYFANQAIQDGNTVTLITDCQKFVNGRLVPTPEEDQVLTNGLRLIRKKYRHLTPSFLTNRVRSVPALFDLIKEIHPDLIYCHALEYQAVNQVLKYVKKTHTPFLADEHADFTNSARNPIARVFLYHIFYRNLVKKALRYLPTIFCISSEVVTFVNKNYNIPKAKLTLLPLGGIIPSEEDYQIRRKEFRSSNGLTGNELVMLHSGKMDKSKKTVEILKAFEATPNPDYRLFIAGQIDAEIKSEVDHLLSLDQRIRFLGWLNSEQLTDALCGSDIYVQLGAQSATLQNAICCKNNVVVFPHDNYQTLLGNAAFFISNSEELTSFFKTINPDMLKAKKTKLWSIAKTKLDYSIQLSLIYSYSKHNHTKGE